MRFFLVDRKNHYEICKKYGLDFEGSYLAFPELWVFHDFWIYEENTFLKRLERIREETAPIQHFSTTGHSSESGLKCVVDIWNTMIQNLIQTQMRGRLWID